MLKERWERTKANTKKVREYLRGRFIEIGHNYQPKMAHYFGSEKYFGSEYRRERSKRNKRAYRSRRINRKRAKGVN